MIFQMHVQPFKPGEDQVKDHQQQKEGKWFEIFPAHAAAEIGGELAWPGQRFQRIEECSVKMREEVESFFRQVRHGPVVIGINFFAALVAEFSRE
jgi:hypothetical protein